MDSKFYFNLKEAAIYRALQWEWCFHLHQIFKKLFFTLFIFACPLFLYGFLTQSFPDKSNSALLGLAIIFLSAAIACQAQSAFFNSKLKNPKIKNENNLAEFLDFETAKAVNAADQFARSSKLPLTNSTALFYFLLEKSSGLEFVFSRNLLNIKEVKLTLKEKVKEYLEKERPSVGYTAEYEAAIRASLETARKRNRERVGIGDVLAALAVYDPVFKKILIDANLKKEDIGNLSWWQESLKKRIQKRRRWWDYDNLIKRGTLAKEWIAGYTLTLDKYSIDWTEIAKRQGFPDIIGHQQEIEAVERVLARQEYNNVLLVGEPGVGRRGIIQGLLNKSAFGQSLPEVNYKRVVELDIPGLSARISDPAKLEATLDSIFQEVSSAGNVIMIINEFHNFIGVKPGPGRIDISGVISPYLHLPKFQVVAVTTYAGLHKNIEPNSSILNLFEKVEVPEISEEETLLILANFALVLEQKYKLFISYPALRETISLTGRFLPAAPFPKKALDFLDEVVIYVKKVAKEKVVLPRHIAKVITEKTQVPVGELETKEKETLLNLEKLIHQRIINQEEAVSEVSTALRRARAEVKVRKGPMGTFLFLGPTGVGKTETSKALAEVYFGYEGRMIRLDMSEFQAVSDIPRLIGAVGEEGLLTTKILESPFSLILLDELEKAHPNILNLFLQVLDEGHLTDGLGRKVDFRNSIIIATSNAGYQIILEALKSKTDWSEVNPVRKGIDITSQAPQGVGFSNGVKQKLLDYFFEKAIFRPEFINRFDAVVVFKPLSKENLLGIAELMLQKLRKNLQEKGIEFVITLPLKEKIVELGYDPTFGARQMNRVIQDKVENALAAAILRSQLKRGNTVKVEPLNFQLEIQ